MKKLYWIFIIIGVLIAIGVSWQLGVFQSVVPSGCSDPYIITEDDVVSIGMQGDEIKIVVDPNDNDLLKKRCIKVYIPEKELEAKTGMNIQKEGFTSYIKLLTKTQVNELSESGNDVFNIGKENIGAVLKLTCTNKRCKDIARDNVWTGDKAYLENLESTFDEETESVSLTKSNCYCYYKQDIGNELHQTVWLGGLEDRDMDFVIEVSVGNDNGVLTKQHSNRVLDNNVFVEYTGNIREDFNWYNLHNNYNIYSSTNGYKIITKERYTEAKTLLDEGIDGIKSARSSDKDDIYREKSALIRARLTQQKLPSHLVISYEGNDMKISTYKGDGSFTPKLSYVIDSDYLKGIDVPPPPPPPKGCQDNNDCSGDKLYCISPDCVACTKDSHCDYKCESNVCIDEPTDCVPACTGDEQCIDKECVDVQEFDCTKDSDCEDDEFCNDANECEEYWVPPLECVDASDCDVGNACIQGRCMFAEPECLGNEQCSEGYYCDIGVTNTCKKTEVAECTESTDCSEDEMCLLESCTKKTIVWSLSIIAGIVLIALIIFLGRRRRSQSLPPRKKGGGF